MKLRDFLETAQADIVTEKQEAATAAIKKYVLQIEELNKALKTAKAELEQLLDTDMEDFDVNVW